MRKNQSVSKLVGPERHRVSAGENHDNKCQGAEHQKLEHADNMKDRIGFIIDRVGKDIVQRRRVDTQEKCK